MQVHLIFCKNKRFKIGCLTHFLCYRLTILTINNESAQFRYCLNTQYTYCCTSIAYVLNQIYYLTTRPTF